MLKERGVTAATRLWPAIVQDSITGTIENPYSSVTSAQEELLNEGFTESEVMTGLHSATQLVFALHEIDK